MYIQRIKSGAFAHVELPRKYKVLQENYIEHKMCSVFLCNV
jgi:hypothetical protein